MLGLNAQQIGMLVLGQVVSLLLVGTNASSAVLAQRGLAAPMLQSFFNYLLLALCYGNAAWRKIRDRSQTDTSWEQGDLKSTAAVVLQFVVFALADVEANYFIVLAYQYASIISITILDCFTIPCVVVLSMLFLGARYKWSHGAGVCLCLGGLILLVLSDLSKLADSDAPAASSVLLGDGLTLLAATLYAVSNISQERLACALGWREVLGGLGVLGSVVAGIQSAALEHEQIAQYRWEATDVAVMVVFVVCLFLLYSTVPQVLLRSGATFLNLSLLTSDFWAIVFGVTVLKERPSPMYFVAFFATVAGLLLYHVQGEPSRLVVAGSTEGATLLDADADGAESARTEGEE